MQTILVNFNTVYKKNLKHVRKCFRAADFQALGCGHKMIKTF